MTRPVAIPAGSDLLERVVRLWADRVPADEIMDAAGVGFTALRNTLARAYAAGDARAAPRAQGGQRGARRERERHSDVRVVTGSPLWNAVLDAWGQRVEAATIATRYDLDPGAVRAIAHRARRAGDPRAVVHSSRPLGPTARTARVFRLVGEGVRHADVAERMGMSRNQVAVLLSKARRRGLPNIPPPQRRGRASPP